MNYLIEKVSSYNIFNYLFPGIVFAAIGTKTTSFDLIEDDIVLGAFLYYFYGMVISRIGSLFLEPLLKKVGFIGFSSYGDFIKACRDDSKIELLSESNNSYRTLSTTFLCLLLLIAAEASADAFDNHAGPVTVGAIISLLAIFTLSYRKQTAYIARRVSLSVRKSEEQQAAGGQPGDSSGNK